MDPELVLMVVALAFFGVVVWLAGVPAGRAGSARDPERLAWWRLVAPLFAGALVFAFLTGWAAQEANPADEHAGLTLHVLAVLTGGVMLRAWVRAARALRSGPPLRLPIATIGLCIPRVVVSEQFRSSISEGVLAAALAHEAAHVKHRDPLRIWLAQLAADLQWPIPGTARRRAAWLLALEIERDDEALAAGAAGEDLAEAILVAARLQVSPALQRWAGAAGGGAGIAWRVRRLLCREVSSVVSPPLPSWAALGSCAALLTAAVWLGIHYGDAILGRLPGIDT
jgi:Zn-dependent protease with chaperone function